MIKGFIRNFVLGGSVGIKVNDDIGHYFQTKQRVKIYHFIELLVQNYENI
jgi:hypothetical protein